MNKEFPSSYQVLGPQIYKIYHEIKNNINFYSTGETSIDDLLEILEEFLIDLSRTLNPDSAKVYDDWWQAKINSKNYDLKNKYRNRIWPRSWDESYSKGGLLSWWLSPDINREDVSNLFVRYIKHPFLKNESLDWIFLSVETFLSCQNLLRDLARCSNAIQGSESFAEAFSNGKIWQYSLIKMLGKSISFLTRWTVVALLYFWITSISSAFLSNIGLSLYICNRIRIFFIKKRKEKKALKIFNEKIKNFAAMEENLKAGIINLNLLREQINALKEHQELYSIFEIIFPKEVCDEKKIIFNPIFE